MKNNGYFPKGRKKARMDDMTNTDEENIEK